MKRAKVFYSDILCGYLIEDEDGYTFYYTKEYLNLKMCKPISLTMPLRHEAYHSIELFPFFDGLIPEGWLLYLTIKTYKIDPRNRYDILLKTGVDTIGCVSVVEEVEHEN